MAVPTSKQVTLIKQDVYTAVCKRSVRHK